MKIRTKIGDELNKFVAGTLESIATRIERIKGPVAPRTAENQAEVLREAAHIVRANRHLGGPR